MSHMRIGLVARVRRLAKSAALNPTQGAWVARVND